MNKLNSNIVVLITVLFFSIGMILYYNYMGIDLWVAPALATDNVVVDETASKDDDTVELINMDSGSESSALKICNTMALSEKILFEHNEIIDIAVRTVTWDNNYDDAVFVATLYSDDGTEIGSVSVDCNDLPNNQLYRLGFHSASVCAGQWVTLVLSTTITEEQPDFAIMIGDNHNSNNVYFENDPSKNISLVVYKN